MPFLWRRQRKRARLSLDRGFGRRSRRNPDTHVVRGGYCACHSSVLPDGKNVVRNMARESRSAGRASCTQGP